MSKKKKVTKFISFGITFGTTMALTLYLAFKGGAWLDEYFGTSPFFSLLGIILGIFINFKNLLESLEKL